MDGAGASHGRLEEAEPASAGLLALVERQIGAGDQLLRLGRVGGTYRYPDRNPRLQEKTLDGERFCEGVQDRLRARGRRDGIADAGQKDREFIAPEPAQHAVRRQGGRQPDRHGLEKGVAGGMPEAKKQGTVRMEGKTYIVKDGDVCHFLFNV